MSDVNSDNGRGILVAAVVGAAVGAGVALLFAPCSGQETRSWLVDRAQDLKGKTTNAFAQAKASMHRAATEIGNDAEDIATTLRS